MFRSLLSLMLAVAFASQGLLGCGMAEAATVEATQDHCAETTASDPDAGAHAMAPDQDAPHDCKHSCHLPALASTASIVAESGPRVVIPVAAIRTVRAGGQIPPAIPPPRDA